MRRVYSLNATAPLLPEALEAAVPYYTLYGGTASSIHRQGREARIAVDDAREHVARLIGAPKPFDLVFTSGGPKLSTSRSAVMHTATARVATTSSPLVLRPRRAWIRVER